jgi:hypothetical protein
MRFVIFEPYGLKPPFSHWLHFMLLIRLNFQALINFKVILCKLLEPDTLWRSWRYNGTLLAVHCDAPGGTLWRYWQYIVTLFVVHCDAPGGTLWRSWWEIVTLLAVHCDAPGCILWRYWRYFVTLLAVRCSQLSYSTAYTSDIIILYWHNTS